MSAIVETTVKNIVDTIVDTIVETADKTTCETIVKSIIDDVIETAHETADEKTVEPTEISTINDAQVVEILKNIDWQKFHNLCSSIGSELNDAQWRFLKAVFLENAVASYSNSQLTYVGNEEVGCDFFITALNNLKIEMKYTTEALFSAKKFTLRKNTKQITLLNSKGTNTHANLPDTYSDYLLVVEMNGAAIISKEKLKKYVTSNGDSLSAIIPTDDMHIIFTPADITMMSEKKKLSIKEKFMSVINEIINDV